VPHETGQPPNEGPEQLKLLSEEELTKLERLSASPQPKAEPPSCETNGIRKICPSKSNAVQDELPFPYAN
jgi:hypothetical protein